MDFIVYAGQSYSDFDPASYAHELLDINGREFLICLNRGTSDGVTLIGPFTFVASPSSKLGPLTDEFWRDSVSDKKVIPRFTHAWHRQKGYSLLLSDDTQAPVTAPSRPAGPTLEQLKGLGYVEFSMSPYIDVQNIDFDTKIYCVTPHDTFGPFSAMVVDFGSSLLPKMSLIGQESVIDHVVETYGFDDRSDALAYLTDVLYHAHEHEPIRFMIEKSAPLRYNIVTLDEKMTGEVHTVHHYETDEVFSALVLDDGAVYSVHPMSVNASDCVVLDDEDYY